MNLREWPYISSLISRLLYLLPLMALSVLYSITISHHVFVSPVGLSVCHGAWLAPE